MDTTNRHEEWRPVVGWEGIYEVSNCGRVKRIAAGKGTRIGRILRPNCSNGYQIVRLRYQGRSDRPFVHRLVARAFIGEPLTDEHQVNHMDGDRWNADLSNLEYVTVSENHLHAFRVLGKQLTGVAVKSRGVSNVKAKLNNDQVITIRSRYAAGGITQQRLADEFGVTQGLIGFIVRREIWNHV